MTHSVVVLEVGLGFQTTFKGLGLVSGSKAFFWVWPQSRTGLTGLFFDPDQWRLSQLYNDMTITKKNPVAAALRCVGETQSDFLPLYIFFSFLIL